MAHAETCAARRARSHCEPGRELWARRAQPSSVRGQHLPLVDRFQAALAAANAPNAPRAARAHGKLVDVERMFHEVGAAEAAP
jgi:hypothetical protein